MAQHVEVHKAAEPDNLSVKGKKRYKLLVDDLLAQGGRAILQPKHDGVYAQFRHVGSEWRAFSRTGQEYLSVRESAIVEAFDRVALPERVYNGELWLPNVAHAEINGRTRKQKPQYLELVLFDSFDPMQLRDGADPTPYIERMDYLFEGRAVSKVRNLFPTDLSSEADLYDLAREYKGRNSAYDGLMLKDRHGEYIPGHGKDGETIKIKPRKSGDFLVVGTTAGEGNRKGGIGALVVSLGNGVTSEVGTGLSMKDVFEGEFVGTVVEVEYLSLTKDGKLREPAYIRQRHDKTEGDVLTHTEVSDAD